MINLSKYTTTLYEICKNLYYEKNDPPPGGTLTVNEMVEKTYFRIFDFYFPWIDPQQRVAFEKKFIKYFLMREISQETYQLWKLMLENRLNEIMPYYLQLMESEKIKFDPLINTDWTDTGTQSEKSINDDSEQSGREIGTNRDRWNNTSDQNTETLDGDLKHTYNENTQNLYGKTETVKHGKINSLSGSDTTKDTNRHSDTPQGSLTDLESNTYMSDATIEDGKTTYGKKDTESGSTITTYGGMDDREDAGTDHDITNNTTKNDRSIISHENEKTDTLDEYLAHKVGNFDRTANDTTTVVGKQGSDTYSKMLIEYRETFLNIEQDILHDCEELFMQIW